MAWIRQGDPTPVHRCKTPECVFGASWLTVPAGTYGDLWRCDDCGALWRRLWRTWHRAGWWLRWRYRHRGRSA